LKKPKCGNCLLYKTPFCPYEKDREIIIDGKKYEVLLPTDEPCFEYYPLEERLKIHKRFLKFVEEIPFVVEDEE